MPSPRRVSVSPRKQQPQQPMPSSFSSSGGDLSIASPLQRLSLAVPLPGGIHSASTSPNTSPRGARASSIVTSGAGTSPRPRASAYDSSAASSSNTTPRSKRNPSVIQRPKGSPNRRPSVAPTNLAHEHKSQSSSVLTFRPRSRLTTGGGSKAGAGGAVGGGGVGRVSDGGIDHFPAPPGAVTTFPRSVRIKVQGGGATGGGGGSMVGGGGGDGSAPSSRPTTAARLGAASPVSGVSAASLLAADPDGARQWRAMQASLLLDSLGRLQHQREQQQDQRQREEARIRQAPVQDPVANQRLMQQRRTEHHLAEEWRQTCEDALLLRLARSSHFRCRSTPSSSEPRPEAPLASLAQWAAAKAAERHQAGGQRQSSLPSSLPPSYLLSLPGSSAEPRPEQLFAAATLEALQAPPAVSGITASEVQLALQLSLQQMSTRIEYDLMPPPVRSDSISRIFSHPFLRLLSELEAQRRRLGLLGGGGGLGAEGRPTAAATAAASAFASSTSIFANLRRHYCATQIQRCYRYRLARRAGVGQRVAHVAEIEFHRRDTELHIVRILQAAMRTRVQKQSLVLDMAHRRMRETAAGRIGRWFRWRSSLRRWNRAWAQTAQADSLLYKSVLTLEQKQAIVRAQAVLRSALVRKRVLPLARRMAAHREARRAKHSLAQLDRQGRHDRRVEALEQSLFVTELSLAREVAAQKDSSARETLSVAKQFAEWNRGMREHFLKKRALPRHWLPQVDRQSGKTYYFNLNTGAISQAHPMQNVVDEVFKQQRGQADQQLQQRLQQKLHEQQQLRERVEQQRNETIKELVQLQRQN